MGQQTGPGDLQQPAGTATSERRMFHVTVTLAGPPVDQTHVRSALEQLADRHQFLLSCRYAADRAEIRFWDEGEHLRDAAARALLLWSDYSGLVALPPWDVVGLEVVDQDTFAARGFSGELSVPPVGGGGVRPF